MPDKRVSVWIQRLKERAPLVLQWIDPETGRRKGPTAGTNAPKEADKARADLEYELNHGRYQEADRMTWERLREVPEAEYVAARRWNTQQSYEDTLNAFE